MSKTDDSSAPKDAIDYKPTKAEAAAAERMIARRSKSPPSPRFKVTYANGKPKIDPDHPDQTCTHVLLADLLATGDSALTEALLIQIANIAQTGDRLTTNDLNTMVAIVKAIGPRDATEALLACQMAAVHNATIYTARRYMRAELLPQYETSGNQMNKLARTFAAQLEALKRYRSTGEQSIRVQHVTVNEGGQAIVGDVRATGGGSSKNASQSHALDETASASSPDAQSAALLGQEQAFRLPMPGSGGEREASLSHARRDGGGSEG